MSYNQFLQFYKNVKRNKILQPSDKLNCQLRDNYFQITLNHLQDVKIDQTMFYSKLKLSSNFVDEKNKKLFGKTQISNLLEFKIVQNTLVLNNPYELFYITKLNDNQISIVIEIEIYYFNEQDQIEKQQFIGCAKFNPFSLISQDVPILKQSLKQLMFIFKKNDQSGTLNLIIKRNNELQQLQHLVQPSCLYGSSEKIQGLETFDLNTIQLKKQSLIEIDNINIFLSIEYKDQIAIAFNQMLTKLRDIKGKQELNQELRIYAYFHNSYEAVNIGQQNNFIPLIQDEKYNLNKFINKYVSQNPLQISNVFESDKAYLIVELAFFIIKDSIQVKYIIGWYPFLLDKNPEQYQKIKLNLITAQNIMDQQIFKLKNERQIQLICEFNEYNKEIVRERCESLELQDQIKVNDQEITQKINEFNNKLIEFEKQKKEFEEYQQKIKREHDELNQQQLEQAQDDIQNQESEKKNNEINSQYLLQLEEFKNYHLDVIQEKNKEVEELKFIIAKIQKEKQLIEEIELDNILIDQKQLINQQIISNVSLKPLNMKLLTGKNKKLGINEQNILNTLGLFKNFDDIQEQPMDLQIDYDDQIKQCLFIVQFLKIKHKKPLYPNKIYATINLFDFPTLKSSNLLYKKNLNKQDEFILLQESHHAGQEFSIQPSFDFSIDYSFDSKKFIDFLNNKQINIDLWESESQFHFGTVKVPLKNLLRQGKDVIQYENSFDIIDQNFTEVKGQIELCLKNVSINQQSQKKTFGMKTKKVISNAPLNLPQEFDKENKLLELSQEERIQQRIQMHKLLNLKQQMNSANNDAKIQLINQIYSYKLQKKSQFLNEALQSFQNEERYLEISQGEVKITPMEIHNNLENETTFEIFINDEAENEISLVNQMDEWIFWCRQSDFPQPKNFNILCSKNIFTLQPNETLTVLIKIQFFRDIEASQRVSKIMCHILNDRVHQGLTLLIQQKSQPIDHIFRFYEKANSEIEISLPTMQFFNEIPTNQPILYCNHKKALYKNIEDDFSISLKTPENAQITKFNVFCYDNFFQANLLGNAQIEIISTDVIKVHTQVGAQITQNLSFIASQDRTCKFYYNVKDLINLQYPHNKLFKINKGELVEVSVDIKLQEDKCQEVLLNCLDQDSNSIIYCAKLIINTETVDPCKIFEFSHPLNIEMGYKFLFKNEINQNQSFQLESSHPEIISIVDKKLFLGGRQQQLVNVKIHKQTQENEAQVLVFCYNEDDDEQNQTLETFLFKIKFINH